MASLVAFWMGSDARCEEVLAYENHPFHICIGEMEWNQEKGIWEVSLRLHPADLQAAIQKQAGKEFTLKEGEEQQEVLDYLAVHFYLTADAKPVAGASRTQPSPTASEAGVSDKAAHLQWVGSETEKSWLWLYLELTPPSRDEALFLVHDLLVDDVEQQANTMVVLRGGQRKSLRFWKDMRKRPLAFDEPAVTPAR